MLGRCMYQVKYQIQKLKKNYLFLLFRYLLTLPLHELPMWQFQDRCPGARLKEVIISFPVLLPDE